MQVKKLIREQAGQSTVEAAFLIPLFLGMILLLVQPGILLFDRMVMSMAAAEGCRLLATSTQASEQDCLRYIERRLGAIPCQDLFHASSAGWDIQLEGDESSESVQVSIQNKVKPLPLIGTAAGFLGLVDEGGYLVLETQAQAKTQPSWLTDAQREMGPLSWSGAWLHD